MSRKAASPPTTTWVNAHTTLLVPLVPRPFSRACISYWYVLVQAASSTSVKLIRQPVTIRYDTIRDVILTCARKPTWVSLIYRTEPTTKKCKNRKTKSRKQTCSEITVNSSGNLCSEYLRRRKEGLQWEGFADKEGFKPEMKDWVGDGIPNNSKYDCWSEL